MSEMPSEEGEGHLGYMPALDGVRALAVLAVMAYHDGISFMPGGFFGVDAFFVLSGFLITSLLVTEHRAKGKIALPAFWARRARRLLPALLVVIIAVVLYARFIAAPGSYPDLRSDALSALFYFANWHFIVSGQNYFIATGPVSPLLHTWSLSIEEQFYIVWPLVVLLIMRTGRRKEADDDATAAARRSRSLVVLLSVSIIGAAASAIEMGLIFNPADSNRVYFGSDTHAQCLLAGTALASAIALRRQRGRGNVTSVPVRRLLDVTAIIGVGVCAWAWSHLSFTQSFVFHGGFALVSVSVAGVLLSIALDPLGIASNVLSFSPLRFLGRISYGMYLWHFPLDIALTKSRVGVGGYGLFGIRAVATIAIATVSFYMIERPIRTGSFFRSLKALFAAPVAVGVTVLAVVLATAAPAIAAAPAHATRPKVAPTLGSGKQSGGSKEASTVAGYANDSVRVLLVGDSVALTLGVGLAFGESPYHVSLYNEGIIGCGLAIGQYYEEHGVVTQSGSPCSPDPQARGCYQFKKTVSVPCQSWEDAWRAWLAELHPNVVVLLAGRWEEMDRTSPAGQWTNILNPSYAQYVKEQLVEAVRIGTSTGARMILETAPCNDSGEQPDGAPWPEDSAQRLDVYNGLVRDVGAEYPNVTVQDLDAVVCPGGTFTPDLHGVPVRAADGVHFLTPSSAGPSQDIGGEYLDPALLPLWESIGHAQEASTRGASVPRGPAYNAFFLAPQ